MTTQPMSDRCAPYRSKLNPAPFATIVPSRTPEVKYHAGLGRAKLAVAYSGGYWDAKARRTVNAARGGEIYERTADGWALLYCVERGTPENELPWKGVQ
ncbi:hypothetical protein ACFWJS_33790 [Streptomyces sp. NPDC127061]|uniref:hypothetical protein n=1 Tax=Streptomyces sp. NPDC127061 TaxID=3347122 RepID=UPI00365132AD